MDDILMTTVELKPCNNCRAKAKLYFQKPYWFAECAKKCGNRTHYFSEEAEVAVGDAKQLAIREWNKFNGGDEPYGTSRKRSKV